jgi:Reverse transcriptase (RNA-dependent DNA polymerase)
LLCLRKLFVEPRNECPLEPPSQWIRHASAGLVVWPDIVPFERPPKLSPAPLRPLVGLPQWLVSWRSILLPCLGPSLTGQFFHRQRPSQPQRSNPHCLASSAGPPRGLLASVILTWPTCSMRLRPRLRPWHLMPWHLMPLQTLRIGLLLGGGPTSFVPWLCGAPLTALAGPNGGVRPIAVGEVIRRLVAKCLMARVRQPAQALLAPLQLGVSVKGGAEAIVHTVRRIITHYLGASVSPDWALLLVDFSNAFNLVRHDVFCQSTLEHFPALGPWVTWCYDSPSHLFYEGQIVCNLARGVQQGDRASPVLPRFAPCVPGNR